MLRRILFTCAVVITASACSSVVLKDDTGPPASASPLPSSTAPEEVATPLPRIAVCLADGKECQLGGEGCCAGSFCAQTGYGFGTCAQKMPNDSFCTADGDCTSGLCYANVCLSEAPACIPLGGECDGFSPCCEGTCAVSYGPTWCVVAGPDGSACGDGNECQSGYCGEGICRSAACVGADLECETDAECCTGFCTGIPNSYIPVGVCHASDQPAGEHCETDLWCASGSCVDSVCQ